MVIHFVQFWTKFYLADIKDLNARYRFHENQFTELKKFSSTYDLKSSSSTSEGLKRSDRCGGL